MTAKAGPKIQITSPAAGRGGAIDGVSAALLAAWPRPEALPTFESIDFDSISARSHGVSAVLVVAGEERAVLGPCADALEERGLGGVVLVDDAVTEARSFEHAGLIVEHTGASPAVLAAELFALCERQSDVDDQALQLRTSALAAGGAHTELEKIHEELQLAANTQRDYIPQNLPVWEGLEVASLFRPAGYVSGDIFDVFQLDDRKIGLFLADAMGHGVPAALMTMRLCKALPKHDGDGSVLPPAIAMERLNRVMCEQRGAHNRFATAVYAVVDRVSGEFWVASGGHPAVFVVRAGGGHDEIGATGPLMGVFEEAEFETEKAELGAGDAIILYTDGFETAFPDAGEAAPGKVPTTRYIEQLRNVALGNDGGLKEGLDTLCEQLDMQAGSLHQVDDLTVLAARYTAAAVSTRAA